MLFNSFTFVAFFAVVLGMHSLPFSWRTKKLNLLLASYLFYAAWNPPFVILIWLSTIVDWKVAKSMGGVVDEEKRRGLVLISLTSNLGLLAFFKYGRFIAENFVDLVHEWGFPLELAKPNILLPVGISFYTFQTLSYTLDVYRGTARPWKSFLDFALFVTFFPQLVAGPIVRAVNFLPQCITPRKASARQLSWGLFLLLLGLFEKSVVADTLMAPLSDQVFAAAGSVASLSAWAGTIAFSIQIFCDFAGYSTCAIGVAACLGFTLPENFRFPYASIGFSDFWQRWHVSLSSWLRDYLYISMGGNRRSSGRTYFNLMMTMLLGGLWHGASWNFVVWGGLHGIYLVVERFFKGHLGHIAWFEMLPVRILLALGTYGLVCITWVFFRARTLPDALSIVGSMLGISVPTAQQLLGKREIGLVAMTLVATLGIHWMMRDTSIESVADRTPGWARGIILGVLLACVAVFIYGGDRAYIYFQF
jgi:alginate O-acetyltransferase complex protein AlgI